jgi:hypothetical protein
MVRRTLGIAAAGPVGHEVPLVLMMWGKGVITSIPQCRCLETLHHLARAPNPSGKAYLRPRRRSDAGSGPRSYVVTTYQQEEIDAGSGPRSYVVTTYQQEEIDAGSAR